MTKAKRRREGSLLSTEIAATLRLAKAFKAQGKKEKAQIEMDKALRLYARRRALVE